MDPVIEEQVKSWGIECVGKDIFTVQGEYSANMTEKEFLEKRWRSISRQQYREDLQSSVLDVRTEVYIIH